MSTQINQFGKGDNISGDKIVGNKIRNVTYHKSPSITVRDITDSQLIVGDNNNISVQMDNQLDEATATLVQKLKSRLEDLSQDYNAITRRGRNRIKGAIIEEIKQSIILKELAVNTLKGTSEKVLIEVLDHPAAQVTIVALKSFIEEQES